MCSNSFVGLPLNDECMWSLQYAGPAIFLQHITR
jgi:hypothetical protein